MRIGFGAVALALLAGVAYLSFSPQNDAAMTIPVMAAPAPEIEAPASAPAQNVSPAELPKAIPWEKLTTVARDENRIIYTTNYLGEAMEVHPDGRVVIYNHRRVFRYPDGHEEVRFITVEAKPVRRMPALPDDGAEGAAPAEPGK